VCACAYVRGRVQGVGFRVFVLDQARRHHVTGYVRNLSDGGVEIVAEGTRAAVEVVLRAVRRGPPGAVVAALDVTWGVPRGEAGFSIREDARA
jgi:acylphosphatase